MLPTACFLYHVSVQVPSAAKLDYLTLANICIWIHEVCTFQPLAPPAIHPHLGIKSWLRAANLVKVAIRTLMVLGA